MNARGGRGSFRERRGRALKICRGCGVSRSWYYSQSLEGRLVVWKLGADGISVLTLRKVECEDLTIMKRT